MKGKFVKTFRFALVMTALLISSSYAPKGNNDLESIIIPPIGKLGNKYDYENSVTKHLKRVVPN